MSGKPPQRTTFRPPWVKDGPNNPLPATAVPWRTKDKTAAVDTAPVDQSNAVHFYIHIFSANFTRKCIFLFRVRAHAENKYVYNVVPLLISIFLIFFVSILSGGRSETF